MLFTSLYRKKKKSLQKCFSEQYYSYTVFLYS